MLPRERAADPDKPRPRYPPRLAHYGGPRSDLRTTRCGLRQTGPISTPTLGNLGTGPAPCRRTGAPCSPWPDPGAVRAGDAGNSGVGGSCGEPVGWHWRLSHRSFTRSVPAHWYKLTPSLHLSDHFEIPKHPFAQVKRTEDYLFPQTARQTRNGRSQTPFLPVVPFSPRDPSYSPNTTQPDSQRPCSFKRRRAGY